MLELMQRGGPFMWVILTIYLEMGMGPKRPVWINKIWELHTSFRNSIWNSKDMGITVVGIPLGK